MSENKVRKNAKEGFSDWFFGDRSSFGILLTVAILMVIYGSAKAYLNGNLKQFLCNLDFISPSLLLLIIFVIYIYIDTRKKPDSKSTDKEKEK